MRSMFWHTLLVFSILLTAVAVFPETQVSTLAQEAPAAEALPAADADGWISLFNGKDLTGWKLPEFGGEGEVFVENGILTINMGAMVSGITLDREFPFRSNYEVEVEASRTMGFDFYSAITFPVGEDGYCTFINGGWGGGVFGLSCVNGFDASENETMQLLTTKNNQWNTFRVRVYDDRIECWMDDKKVVDCPRADNKFSTRFEVEYSQPLGVTNYCCESKIRAIRVREMKAEK